MQNFFLLAWLTSIQVEFRPASVDAVQQIVMVLNEKESDVRITGINALAKLSEQGRTSRTGM